MTKRKAAADAIAKITSSSSSTAAVKSTKKTKNPQSESTSAPVKQENSPKKQVTNESKPKEIPQNESKAKEPSTAPSKSSQLKVGSKVPDSIMVVDHEGTEHKLVDLCADTGIVIFFYPKANTPGCTKQACGFRDNYQKIIDVGYQVYGMSGDSSKSQASWAGKYELPFKLLSDLTKDRRGLKALGVNKAPSSVVRSHIVIGKGGEVELVHYQVSPLDSVNEAVAFCTSTAA